MLTNFVYFNGTTGETKVFSMVHVEIDRDQGGKSISFSLDNGNVYVISNKDFVREIQTNNTDSFECLDGSRYCLIDPKFE